MVCQWDKVKRPDVQTETSLNAGSNGSKIQMIVISTKSKLNVLYYKFWLRSFEKIEEKQTQKTEKKNSKSS